MSCKQIIDRLDSSPVTVDFPGCQIGAPPFTIVATGDKVVITFANPQSSISIPYTQGPDYLLHLIPPANITGSGISVSLAKGKDIATSIITIDVAITSVRKYQYNIELISFVIQVFFQTYITVKLLNSAIESFSGTEDTCPATPTSCDKPTLCITAFLDNEVYQDVTYASFNVGDCVNHECGFGKYRGFIQTDTNAFPHNTVFYVTLLGISDAIIGEGSLTQKLIEFDLKDDFLQYALLKFILWRLIGNEFNIEGFLRRNYDELIKGVEKSVYKNALPTLLRGSQFEVYFKC